jgi:hypothetical protein
MGDRGGAVVKVLCYKSEGRWFQMVSLEFLIDINLPILTMALGSSHRNDYQGNFLGINAAGASG